MTKAEKIRRAYKRLESAHALPLADPMVVPYDVRLSLRKAAGASMYEVVAALGSDPSREGRGAGRKPGAATGKLGRTLARTRLARWLRAVHEAGHDAADAADGVERGDVDLWQAPGGGRLEPDHH